MDGGIRTNNITLAREPFAAVYDEAAPLLLKHYREIASYQDIPLEVDRAFYDAADAAGMLRIFTARVTPREAIEQVQGRDITIQIGRAGSVLIGYACFIVRKSPHYASSLQAVNDVVYVDPTYRRGRSGIALLRFAENALRDEGIEIISYHCKTKHPALSTILYRMGYDANEVMMMKRLNVTRR